MKKYVISFVISLFVYAFVLSLAHSYYLMQINASLEEVILDLEEQVIEMQQNVGESK